MNQPRREPGCPAPSATPAPVLHLRPRTALCGSHDVGGRPAMQAVDQTALLRADATGSRFAQSPAGLTAWMTGPPDRDRPLGNLSTLRGSSLRRRHDGAGHSSVTATPGVPQARTTAWSGGNGVPRTTTATRECPARSRRPSNQRIDRRFPDSGLTVRLRAERSGHRKTGLYGGRWCTDGAGSRLEPARHVQVPHDHREGSDDDDEREEKQGRARRTRTGVGRPGSHRECRRRS